MIKDQDVEIGNSIKAIKYHGGASKEEITEERKLRLPTKEYRSS